MDMVAIGGMIDEVAVIEEMTEEAAQVQVIEEVAAEVEEETKKKSHEP